MNPLAGPIVRFMLVAVLPWSVAFYLTSRKNWFESRWLDRSIRIQTALLAMIFSAQIAGQLGIYRLTEAWLAPLIYFTTTHLLAKSQHETSSSPKPIPSRFDTFFTMLALGLLALEFGRMFVPSFVGAVKVVSDAPIYHLFFAAKWWVAGQIYWIPIPFGETAAPYFPANGDLWFMTLIGWTGNLALAKVGQVPFWFLAGWLVFELCQRLGASRTSSLVASALWMTITPLAVFTFEANVDTIFSAWFIASILFYVEYDLRQSAVELGPNSKSNRLILIHSLLAAGLAWGTKAPGLVFIPPWIAFVSFNEFHRNQKLPQAKRLLEVIKIWLISIVPVLFWWLRNYAATGNPLYPLPVEIGGITLLEGWYGTDVMRLSPYYIPFSMWRAFVDQWLAVIDPRVFPLGLVAIVWFAATCKRPESDQRRWVGRLILIGLLTIAIYWSLVPYRTQQRFFLHGLMAFMPVLAIGMDRFKWLKISALAVLLLHVLTPQCWPLGGVGREPPWDLSPMVPNGIPSLVPIQEIVIKLIRGDLNSLGLICFAFAMVILIVHIDQKRKPLFKAAVLICGMGLVMMITAERAMYLKVGRGLKYPIFPDYERAWLAFDAVSKKTPQAIAYSGTNLAIYLMGNQLQNSVEYVNCDLHKDWLLHDYHLAQPKNDRRWPDPRPTWDRLAPDYEAWLENLKRRKIDLVVVARANPMEGRMNPHDSMGFPIERTWMEQHPLEFAPVYGIREGDPEMRIYKLSR